MSRLQDVILRGIRSAQPLATLVAPGTLYFVTDEGKTEQSNGTSWLSYSGLSASALPQFGLPDIVDEFSDWPRSIANPELSLGNPLVDDYILSSKTTGIRSWVIAPTGFTAPSYYGKIAGAYGQGDPALLMQRIQGGYTAASLSNISTTVARCNFFRLPFNLTINKIRFYGVGTTGTVLHAAIYRYSDLARLAIVDNFGATANTWGAAGSALNLALVAGTLYFIAISTDTAGSTNTIAGWGGSIGSTYGQIQSTPSALPGNLSAASDYLSGYTFQFATTAGAMPNPAATLAQSDTWIGGMPAFFLDNNNG